MGKRVIQTPSKTINTHKKKLTLTSQKTMLMT